MVGATKSQNKSDRLRLATISQIGCVPCMIDGWDGALCTIQHVTEGGRRLDDEHQMTYGSCEWHHLGIKPRDFGGSMHHAEKKYGPSFARNKRDFMCRYGTERELIQVQDALIRAYMKAHREARVMSSAALGKFARELFAEIVMGKSPSSKW